MPIITAPPKASAAIYDEDSPFVSKAGPKAKAENKDATAGKDVSSAPHRAGSRCRRTSFGHRDIDEPRMTTKELPVQTVELKSQRKSRASLPPLSSQPVVQGDAVKTAATSSSLHRPSERRLAELRSRIRKSDGQIIDNDRDEAYKQAAPTDTHSHSYRVEGLIEGSRLLTRTQSQGPSSSATSARERLMERRRRREQEQMQAAQSLQQKSGTSPEGKTTEIACSSQSRLARRHSTSDRRVDSHSESRNDDLLAARKPAAAVKGRSAQPTGNITSSPGPQRGVFVHDYDSSDGEEGKSPMYSVQVTEHRRDSANEPWALVGTSVNLDVRHRPEGAESKQARRPRSSTVGSLAAGLAAEGGSPRAPLPPKASSSRSGAGSRVAKSPETDATRATSTPNAHQTDTSGAASRGDPQTSTSEDLRLCLRAKEDEQRSKLAQCPEGSSKTSKHRPAERPDAALSSARRMSAPAQRLHKARLLADEGGADKAGNSPRKTPTPSATSFLSSSLSTRVSSASSSSSSRVQSPTHRPFLERVRASRATASAASSTSEDQTISERSPLSTPMSALAQTAMIRARAARQALDVLAISANEQSGQSSAAAESLKRKAVPAFDEGGEMQRDAGEEQDAAVKRTAQPASSTMQRLRAAGAAPRTSARRGAGVGRSARRRHRLSEEPASVDQPAGVLPGPLGPPTGDWLTALTQGLDLPIFPSSELLQNDLAAPFNWSRVPPLHGFVVLVDVCSFKGNTRAHNEFLQNPLTDAQHALGPELCILLLMELGATVTTECPVPAELEGQLSHIIWQEARAPTTKYFKSLPADRKPLVVGAGWILDSYLANSRAKEVSHLKEISVAALRRKELLQRRNSEKPVVSRSVREQGTTRPVHRFANGFEASRHRPWCKSSSKPRAIQKHQLHTLVPGFQSQEVKELLAEVDLSLMLFGYFDEAIEAEQSELPSHNWYHRHSAWEPSSLRVEYGQEE